MGKEYMDSEDSMESEEYVEKYPTPELQYPNAAKYSTYESIQTGAMGKAAQ